MKRITRLFLYAALLLAVLFTVTGRAEADPVLCAPGETIQATFVLPGGDGQPAGVMGRLSYDKNVFTLLPSKDVIGHDGVYVSVQPVTVSFAVSQYATVGAYTISVEVLQAAGPDGLPYENASIEPVQVSVVPAGFSVRSEPGADAGNRWAARMDLPAREEIDAFRPRSRSPYIILKPEFDGGELFTEYAVDFRMDHLPAGTYLAVCNWDTDLTVLRRSYAKVYREYNGVAAYAGFQVQKDGSHAAIVSVWDTYCETKRGETTAVQATVVYPDAGGRFDNEGSGMQCVVPFDWQEGKSYRALIQQERSAKGTVLVDFWVRDLESGIWTLLVQYDTWLSDTSMVSPCAFLENFTIATAGEIRSVEMWNFRARSRTTGRWVGGMAAAFSEEHDWTGSYRYGSEGAVYWAVTTGLPDRCETPGQNLRCTVTECETGNPY